MQMIPELLSRELASRQVKNPSYSLRALARDIGISPTTVSLVIKGRRKLSGKALQQIVACCDYNEQEKQQIISKLKSQTDGGDFHELDLHKLSVISDWYFFAILSLMETASFKHEPKWIAKRLGVPTKVIRDALFKLERLELISRSQNGIYRRTKINFRTPDMVPSPFLQKSHLQALELAKKSIINDEVTKRNVSAMTMAIDPDLLPEAAEMIKRFRRKLCRFLESSSNKREVYRIAIQLFPLSKELV